MGLYANNKGVTKSLSYYIRTLEPRNSRERPNRNFLYECPRWSWLCPVETVDSRHFFRK